ncbi:MAG: hypothetical protein NVS4B13_05660 [Candidatus Elarobacter sp.]
MIEIRRAGKDYASLLARLRAASLIEQRHLAGVGSEMFREQAADDFARLFADGRLAAWLLCDAEAVVGSACAIYFERLPFPDGTLHAELSGVYVKPRYRGAGHASRLVGSVVEDVESSGARKTFLRPSPASRSLYARLGFVDDATGVMSLA